MAIIKPIPKTDPSIKFETFKRKRKENKVRPTFWKRIASCHIPLGWLINVLIKKSQLSEGPSTQGMSSTSITLLDKKKVAKKAPLLGVNQNLDAQADPPTAEGHDIKQPIK